jgi:SAM-dependent methyltransferase
MVDRSLIGGVERYYTAKVQTHGATPQGVDWNGEDSQRLRFDQLLRLIDGQAEPMSVIDYGCGYGGLVESLAARVTDFSYCGYDVSEAMIAAARDAHGEDQRVSFVSKEQDLRPADFTIASGILNVRLGQPEDAWREYVLETLDKLAAVSRRGFAFNALTSHSDPERMRPDLFYADPAVLLDHCLQHYSRNVVLDHDYELYEFSVIVRLDRRKPAQRSRG